MTPEQRDMLQTLKEHDDISAVSYRLTFTPDQQKWAREMGYVQRVRGKFRLTAVGSRALSPHDRKAEQ